MSSALRTLEQERAKHAWDCVQNCLNQAIQQLESAIAHETEPRRREDLERRLRNLRTEEGGKEWKGRYGSVVRKLPSYILTSGLGQTLAFLKAKGKGEPGNEHEVLYRHLTDWVGRKVKRRWRPFELACQHCYQPAISFGDDGSVGAFTVAQAFR